MQNTVDLGKQLDNIDIANTCKCVIPEQNVREKSIGKKKKHKYNSHKTIRYLTD